MDHTVEKVLRNLETSANNLAEQILAGRLVSLEMYQAQCTLRNACLSMIADIKEDLANDRHADEIEDDDTPA